MQAKTDKIVIEGDKSPTSSESARENREQWNDTRSMRAKVNRRNEKEYDKIDRAYDLRDACTKSINVNAYWENETRRCLDRHTGREINSP